MIAACTSEAAPSILRDRSNCNVIDVVPCTFDDVIWFTPGSVANWRSRGCATEDAMISGLAPGSVALTLIVGKSTVGSAATGNRL